MVGVTGPANVDVPRGLGEVGSFGRREQTGEGARLGVRTGQRREDRRAERREGLPRLHVRSVSRG